MLPALHRRGPLDPMDPMRPACTGALERTLMIGEKPRRVVYYIPEGTPASTAAVMILPPTGVSAEEFLEQSNWRAIADAEETMEKLILVIMEDDGTGWHTDEFYGDPNGDCAYVFAVNRDMIGRSDFCIHESKHYMVGYGAGATMAQMAAMSDPAGFSAVACIGSAPVSEAFRMRAAEAPCINLMGFFDDTGLGLKNRDVGVPMWLISGDARSDAELTPDLRYWCTVNRAVLQHGCVAKDTISFVREEEGEWPRLLQEPEAYRVWSSRIPNAAKKFGLSVNNRIWKDFFFPVRRWMSEPGGSMRMTEDPIRTLKCEYHYELVTGWMREWYVYIPKQVRENHEKPAPVVFAFHGYTCTGEVFLGATSWNRIADRYGFIVVSPTAPYDHIPGRDMDTEMPSWNIFSKPGLPDELALVRHILSDLNLRFTIDNGRIFATGHSYGSVMTQFVGMSMPDVFTAIAPMSGALFDGLRAPFMQNPNIVKHPYQEMPVWMFIGEREPHYFDHIPSGENTIAETIRIWWKRNEMPGEEPRDFSEGWHVTGRWHDISFMKNCHPLIRYSWVKSMPHSTNPEMSERIWCEFFSKVHRDPKTGALSWKE